MNVTEMYNARGCDSTPALEDKESNTYAQQDMYACLYSMKESQEYWNVLRRYSILTCDIKNNNIMSIMQGIPDEEWSRRVVAVI